MKKYAFIDLHIHSEHSYEDGCDISVREILDNCVELVNKVKQDFTESLKLAQTDSDVMSVISELLPYVYSSDYDVIAQYKEIKDFSYEKKLEFAKQFISQIKACISITDHNSIMGSVEALNLKNENKEKYDCIELIPGAEFNASLKSLGLDEQGRSIFSKCHILTYDYNINDKNLLVISKLTHLYTPYGKKRANTGQQIIWAKKLVEQQMGYPIPFDQLEPCLLESTHEGVRRKFVEVLTSYYNVSEKKIAPCVNVVQITPCYSDQAVGESKINIVDICKITEASGGLLSIAHPKSIKYKKRERYTVEEHAKVLEDFLTRLMDISGVKNLGLEVYHNQNTSDGAMKRMTDLCRKYNLFLSAGSDHHGIHLHENNLISKCFCRKFEYASVNDKSLESKLIKNIVKKLALVEFVNCKKQGRVFVGTRRYESEVENIEKGTFNQDQILKLENATLTVKSEEVKAHFDKRKDNKSHKKQKKHKELDPRKVNSALGNEYPYGDNPLKKFSKKKQFEEQWVKKQSEDFAKNMPYYDKHDIKEP